MLVMDKYDLRPDPCDFQLIRFSNCIFMLSCVCEIASLVNRDLRHVSRLLHTVSDIVFYTTLGMMAAQSVYEVRYQQSGNVLYNVPTGTAVVEKYQTPEGGETDGLLASKKALL